MNLTWKQRWGLEWLSCSPRNHQERCSQNFPGAEKKPLLWFSTSHSPWFPRAHKITSRLFFSIRDHLVPGCHDDVGLQTELKRNQFYPKDISDRNYCYHWWFTSWLWFVRIKWVGEFKSDLKCWFGENAERVENPRSCSILISEDQESGSSSPLWWW